MTTVVGGLPRGVVCMKCRWFNHDAFFRSDPTVRRKTLCTYSQFVHDGTVDIVTGYALRIPGRKAVDAYESRESPSLCGKLGRWYERVDDAAGRVL